MKIIYPIFPLCATKIVILHSVINLKQEYLQ